MSFTQELLDVIQQRNIILAVYARSSANLLESKIEVKVTEIRLINEQVWLARMEGVEDLCVRLRHSKQRKTNEIRKYECLLDFLIEHPNQVEFVDCHLDSGNERDGEE